MKQLFLSKDWFTVRFRIKRSVRRHMFIFPFLGGLIVYWTLHTVDEFKHQVQEVDVMIDSADNFFRIDTLGHTVLGSLTSITQRIQPSFSEMGSEHLVSYEQYSLMFDRVVTNSFALRAFEESIHAIKRVDDNLPLHSQSEYVKDSISKAEANVRKAKANNDKAMDKYFRVPVRRIGNWTGVRAADFHSLEFQYSLLASEAQSLQSDVQEAVNLTLIEGEWAREVLKYRYRWFSRLSYLLYLIGMGLTLTGKIWASDDQEGTGEAA